MTKLFEPITLGALRLKHRVVMAPMTRLRADPATGVPSEWAKEYYSQRATDGGLIISEGTMVAKKGSAWPGTPGLYTPEQIARWREITDAVHAKGGLMVAQLAAAGRVADPVASDGLLLSVGEPDPIPATAAAAAAAGAESPAPPSVVRRSMTQADIDEYINYFVQAAKNAMEAGFDGVEIHSGFGYLLDQFLHSATNTRSDSYGGSIANRLRFPLAVLDAVAEAITPQKVGIRISPFSAFQGMREPASSGGPMSVFVPFLQAVRARQPNLAYVDVVEPAPKEELPSSGVSASDPGSEQGQGEEDSVQPLKQALYGRDADGQDGQTSIEWLASGFFAADSALQRAEATNDVIVFGSWFTSNPDLPERIKNTWPLTAYDKSTFYTPGPEGYIDHPVYQP